MRRESRYSTLARGLALAVVAVTLAGPAYAQTVDVSGTWDLQVSTDQGVTTPTFTLAQDGNQLTGTYSSEALGEADLTGSVDGADVTISFTASLQGQAIPVVYRGTVGSDGTMSGTLDLADGALTGTFTATRTG